MGIVPAQRACHSAAATCCLLLPFLLLNLGECHNIEAWVPQPQSLTWHDMILFFVLMFLIAVACGLAGTGAAAVGQPPLSSQLPRTQRAGSALIPHPGPIPPRVQWKSTLHTRSVSQKRQALGTQGAPPEPAVLASSEVAPGNDQLHHVDQVVTGLGATGSGPQQSEGDPFNEPGIEAPTASELSEFDSPGAAGLIKQQQPPPLELALPQRSHQHHHTSWRYHRSVKDPRKGKSYRQVAAGEGAFTRDVAELRDRPECPQLAFNDTHAEVEIG